LRDQELVSVKHGDHRMPSTRLDRIADIYVAGRYLRPPTI
jgi:hypothetical protein